MSCAARSLACVARTHANAHAYLDAVQVLKRHIKIEASRFAGRQRVDRDGVGAHDETILANRQRNIDLARQTTGAKLVDQFCSQHEMARQKNE